MRLEIRRVDPSLPLPAYNTPGAVAFDLYARVETAIGPKELVRIPSNLIVSLPAGYTLLVASRSSTPRKGLLVPHGIGVIDQDFRGPEDEVAIQLYNFTDRTVTVRRGERIAQALIMPIKRCVLTEKVSQETDNRGGFGSTG
ncbi:dUTPase [Parcubacteria bacterium SG8_24]|nr:MAG: dUTPase [Parcubacteria bacterium SG8_24]